MESVSVMAEKAARKRNIKKFLTKTANLANSDPMRSEFGFFSN